VAVAICSTGVKDMSEWLRTMADAEDLAGHPLVAGGAYRCHHERRERCLFFEGAWRFVCLSCSAVLSAAAPRGEAIGAGPAS
jgi:hypothetical protein